MILSLWACATPEPTPTPTPNRAPTATGASLQPAAFHRGTGVRCVGAGFADPDGDPVGWRYAWSVDGEVVPDTDDALDAGWWRKGSAVTCRIAPDDGALTGDWLEASGVAGDAPLAVYPTFGAVGIRAMDPLWCQLGPGSGDPDGDPVTWSFTWLRDGAPALPDAETALPGDTISASEVTTGRTWTCTVTGSGPSGLVAGAVTARPPSAGGNILIVVIDDWGVDKSALFTATPTPPPTPNLDALAAGGLVFDHAWAMPVCSSSRAAYLTGRYPRRHGIGAVLDYWETAVHLSYEETLIPEMLTYSPEHTYDTSFVGKWHVGSTLDPDGVNHPNLAGFGWFAGSMGNLGNPWVTSPSTWPHDYDNWERIENGVPAAESGYATTVTTDDAIARAAAMSPPWLLVASYNAGHTPLRRAPADLAPTIQDTPTDVERYASMIEALDTELGRLFAALPPDTTILVFGDNGTDDVAMLPPWGGELGKGSVTEGGVRVPMIVAGPLVRAPGSRSAALVNVVDVFATVAQIGGVELADVPGWDGAPVEVDGLGLLPYLADPAAPSQRAYNYTERFLPLGAGPFNTDLRAVSDGRWKLTASLDHGVMAADGLYDLVADGGLEANNLLLGPLDPEQQLAYDALNDALEGYQDELVYSTGSR